MSPGDRAEGVARLRRAVATIEGRREAAPAHPTARLPLTRALDRALGGGLACDGLHEIAPASALDASAATGFALALAAVSSAGAPPARAASSRRRDAARS